MGGARRRCAQGRRRQPNRWPLENLVTRQSIADDTAAVRYVRSALQRSPGEGYALACEALAAADLRPLAGKITAPTLIVCGDDDIPSFLDAARWLTENIRGAR